MFNKNREITIMTRFENEDHFKITKFAGTWLKPGEAIEVNALNDEVVEIKFITSKSCVKKIEEQLNLLKFVGIKAEMKIR